MMNQGRTQKHAAAGIQTGISTKKMVLTAMLACLAYVLNTFVYFPAMAPFQHFVDMLAAVLVGPWYGFLAALICGMLRMLSGRTIQAVAGAVFGPILGGLIYRKTKSIWLTLVGEVVGTGFFGAMVSYPLMKIFYGLGVCVLLILNRTGLLARMQHELSE